MAIIPDNDFITTPLVLVEEYHAGLKLVEFFGKKITLMIVHFFDRFGHVDESSRKENAYYGDLVLPSKIPRNQKEPWRLP